MGLFGLYGYGSIVQRTLIVELVVVLGTKKWSTVSYYFTTRSGTVKILDQRAIPGI